jgi:hypothetical protein
MGEGKFDPHRRLCPDGACIGVIGSDGRCHVCGRAASGGPAAAALAVSTDENEVDDEVDGEDDGEDETGDESESLVAAAASAGGFDPKRRLCPDGDCLGVIGADGVCNVCGKKAG